MAARGTLGLGLAALGRPGYMTLGHAGDLPDASEAGLRANAFATLDEAWRLGVRHFDAARSYGLAEAFLGEWLRERQPEGAVVSSKWGYRYTADWQREAPVHEVKEHTLAHLEAQWPSSQAHLGPWLRVYQIHSFTPDSPALDDPRLLDRLAELRDTGVAIGASVSGPRQPALVERLLGVERGGQRLFTWVQATWNLLERSAGPALTEAAGRGVRVIVKEGLANGLLTARGPPTALHEAAAARGTTPDALALAVALAQPFAPVVLSGATTPAQLASNARAQRLQVGPDDLIELTQAPAAYWARRAALKWS